MKKLTRFLILGILFGFAGSVFAEDVVYLKDGSIIHGTITEEVPGVSLKIQTKDGNLFVYKIKAVDISIHVPHAEDDREIKRENILGGFDRVRRDVQFQLGPVNFNLSGNASLIQRLV